MEFKQIFRQLMQLKAQFNKQIDTGFSLWNQRRMETWELKKSTYPKTTKEAKIDFQQDNILDLKIQ